MYKGKNYIVFFLLSMILMFFSTNLVFISKPFIIYKSPLIEEGDWLQFWGSLLGFIGTLSLGLLAFWQNQVLKKENEQSSKALISANDAANAMNAELLMLTASKRLSVVSIDDGDFLTIYFEDEGNKFIRLLNNNVYIYIPMNFIPTVKFHSDHCIVQFYAVNISENYVNSVVIDTFTIYGENETGEYEHKVRLVDEEAVMDKLVAPGNKIKIFVVLENFNSYLKEGTVEEQFGFMFDMDLEYRVKNIYGDTTNIKASLFLQCSDLIEDYDKTSNERNYEIQYNYFNIM